MTTDRSWTSVMLPDVPLPKGAYSPGVKAGNMMFVSGQIPRDPLTGAIVGEDVIAQAKQTFANIEGVLKAGGASLENVVNVTVFLADENDWEAFDEFYRTVFSAPFPTRAVIGSQLRGILIEVTAVAYIP